MKITEINALKDCFDGESIREIYFDKIITKDFIFHLGKLGDLKYFPTFAKPFFKIVISENYVIKGAQETDSLKAIGKGKTMDEFLNLLNLFVSQFKD